MLKHLGENTLVVDQDNALCPDWKMARLEEIVLLGKTGGQHSPNIVEHSASGAAFSLDLSRLVYSLRWHTRPRRRISNWL